MIDFETVPSNIKIVGVGGGGNNAIDRMIDAGMQGVEFISLNTDIKSLGLSRATTKIQIGEKLTKGLGAGARPEIGQKAAEESKDLIRDAIKGADMVFITAGMGGGTGTGAAPVVASISKELGILTVAVVTKPFGFEGNVRMKNAIAGIERLTENVDSIIVILNSNLKNYFKSPVTISQSFQVADDTLRLGIQSITDTINIPSLINLDFADVKTIMQNKGSAHMGYGIGKGSNKAKDAALNAMNSVLLETNLDGSEGLLINISGGPDMTLSEIEELVMQIREVCHHEAEVIFGATIKEDLKDEIHVSLVATGLLGSKKAIPIKNNDEILRVPDFLKELDASDDYDIPAFMRNRNFRK
jgi:cell division protein FtsZ